MNRLLPIGYSDELAREAVAHKMFWLPSLTNIHTFTFDNTSPPDVHQVDVASYITEKTSSIYLVLQITLIYLSWPAWFTLYFGKPGSANWVMVTANVLNGDQTGGLHYENIICPLSPSGFSNRYFSYFKLGNAAYNANCIMMLAGYWE